MIRNFKLLAQIVITKSHIFYFEEEIIFICRRKNPENIGNLKVLSLQTFFMFYLSQYGLFGKFRAKNPHFSKIPAILNFDTILFNFTPRISDISGSFFLSHELFVIFFFPVILFSGCTANV